MKALKSWLLEFVPALPSAEALSLCGLAVEREEGDTIEFDITSNRPDWLSHYGVAREIAALTSAPLAALPAAPLPAGAGFTVVVDAPRACPRFCAVQLDGVAAGGPSDPAVLARLQALGHRGINAMADLTNYVLHEMGQPTHAYDADKLRGARLIARFARKSETLVTLDGVTRTLTPDDLIIADAERPVGLAGVMGGLETLITASTRRVVLEAAYFDPLTVRRMARRHNLHTDASHRFERGADRAAGPQALALLCARSGARTMGGMTDVGGPGEAPAAIRLRPEALVRVLGADVPLTEAERILAALGVERGVPPSWRHDLSREIDLIEEIARLHGYDKFPARLPAFSGAAAPLPEAALRDRVRTQLRGRGFAEAVTLSFAAEAECAEFAPNKQPVRVLNPLSEEAAILRTSSLPAMLHLLRNNLNHGVAAPRLYEIGKLYFADSEPAVLSIGVCDAALDHRAFKGEIEAVLDLFETGAPSLARYGRIDPATATRWKLPQHTWTAELDLAALYRLGPRRLRYTPPSRFPASERDFSFLFENRRQWQEISAALLTPPIAELASLEPVEIFRGPGLAPGHYALLIRARFQSQTRTLIDAEVQAGAEEIIRRLASLGGTQR
ncbi:MAG TPA: phenylalanine--tRNA ligase subunit beta [Terriglobales bacterium]|nr:phenylalanine--tRNA ligase subunit beta [Terriglobales bacterium]